MNKAAVSKLQVFIIIFQLVKFNSFGTLELVQIAQIIFQLVALLIIHVTQEQP